jgi:hypothetical protein
MPALPLAQPDRGPASASLDRVLRRLGLMFWLALSLSPNVIGDDGSKPAGQPAECDPDSKRRP